MEIRVVSADRVAQAQKIIASAKEAGEAEQNRAIEEAIKLLYPYAPREGQRNALRQLIGRTLYSLQRPRLEKA